MCLASTLFFLLVCLNYAHASNKIGNSTNAERIIGGSVAKTGQFPFSAAITAVHEDGRYFCGGSIISELWILSSATCIFGAWEYEIQLGSNQLNGADQNRVLLTASSYAPHPDFHPGRSLANDIALIRLHLPITFTEYVQPIALPLADVAEDASVTSIGWGQTSDEVGGLSNSLEFVELVTIPNTECRAFYGSQVEDTMVCVVGQTNEGICIGDNGGPLVEYKQGRTPVQVALATFVSGDGCESDLPSGFTRIYPYLEWISIMMD